MVASRAGRAIGHDSSALAVNPFGLLVLALGVIIVIVGVKGSQHNLVAALTNKKQAGTSTASSSSSSSPSTSTVQLVL